MDVVTLVPWRAGDPRREKYWERVRPHLEALGYPLFTGDSEGPWARSAACNAAAQAAGAWEIALVADADTFLEPDVVHRTIQLVARTRGAARPHDHRWMLNSAASKLFLAHGASQLEPGRHLRGDAPGGGALVVHREAFDEVGGYDERFIGWGYEDSAMNIELASRRRWERVPGNSYHLSHPMTNILATPVRANGALLEELRAERAREIAQASRRAGYDLNTVL